MYQVICGRCLSGPAADAIPRGGHEAVLLVEDDNAVRMTTRRVLESHGYKVHEATGAREAVEIWNARKEEIALLLTDMIMPDGLTGRDLAVQLRAQKRDLKVIVMSGYSPDETKGTDFLHRGKVSFLPKPCGSRKLLEVVRQCLDED